MRNLCERDNMLYQISVLDFATVDLAEYLDTHPEDEKAIEYFTHYKKMKNKACEEFAQKYYPLTLDAATERGEVFKWAYAPLPWEC